MRRVPTTVEPKVPIKRHVKRIRSLVFGLVLKAFASGICVFGVRNRVPADLQIGQIFSDVCLSVCLCSFFCRTTFGPGRWLLTRKYAKNHSKRGFLSEFGRQTRPLLGFPHMMSLLRIFVNLLSSLTPLAVNCVGLVCLAGGATCPAGSF